MLQRFEQVDTIRKDVARRISRKRKSEFGQFMTPAAVARFMASLFSPSTLQAARVFSLSDTQNIRQNAAREENQAQRKA
jgi:type I restriction-modification system DNA methylase subunit